MKGDNMEYCKSDVNTTLSLYNHLASISLSNEIVKLREQIDLCDDIYERQRLARKILRLKNSSECRSTW